eukprot:216096-Amphidinium_carterae.1
MEQLWCGVPSAQGIHLVRGIMPQMFEASEWELFQGGARNRITLPNSHTASIRSPQSTRT